MSTTTGAEEPDLTTGDLIGVGLLASPGFVLPPLLGPTFETVALTLVTTAAAVAWVARRSGVFRRGRRADRLSRTGPAPR